MRLTSKGQVTVPQEIREALGLLPYTEVEFEIDGDSVRLGEYRSSIQNPRPADPHTIEHTVGRLVRGPCGEQPVGERGHAPLRCR